MRVRYFAGHRMAWLTYAVTGFLYAITATVLAQSETQLDDEAIVHALEGVRTLSDNPADAKTQVAKLFKLRAQVKPEIAEWLLKATATGLIAIDDKEAYSKIRAQMRDPKGFEDVVFENCNKCAGTGKGHVKCMKCNGSGKCPNHSCRGGVVIRQQIGSYPQEQKCPICEGSGRCKRCKGAGTLASPCTICGGKGYSIDKNRAIQLYGSCIDHTIGMLNGSANVDQATHPSNASRYSTPMEASKQVAFWRSNVSASLSSRDSASHFLQGLARNTSGASDKFQEFEFDFSAYGMWRERETTKLQKKKIIERLYAEGLKSGFYKEFIRCYFALVPDGLSFIVTEVSELSFMDNIIGPEAYRVTIELMVDGGQYQTGTGRQEWKGQPWQSKDLRHFLTKEALFPSRLCLIVPTYYEEVESWQKGKILTSKGWIYDIRVWDAVYNDGSGKIIQKIDMSNNAFRSIEERTDLEYEFETESDSTQRQSTQRQQNQQVEQQGQRSSLQGSLGRVVTCPICNGAGKRNVSGGPITPTTSSSQIVPCQNCGGTGAVPAGSPIKTSY